MSVAYTASISFPFESREHGMKVTTVVEEFKSIPAALKWVKGMEEAPLAFDAAVISYAHDKDGNYTGIIWYYATGNNLEAVKEAR